MSRKFPLRQPEGWEPPIPRSRLEFQQGTCRVYTLYVGLQDRSDADQVTQETLGVQQRLEARLFGTRDGDPESSAPLVERLGVTTGFDIVGSRVWVRYWTDECAFEKCLRRLDLEDMWRSLPLEYRQQVGVWAESFSTPLERLETNYSLTVHRPGLSSLPGTTFTSHRLSGYWGAARDRLDASSTDGFDASRHTSLVPPEGVPQGLGQRLTGTSYDDMCHIRSGQWWVLCGEEERAAYESTLQPTLIKGMEYLCEFARDNGNLGLRFMTNLDDEGRSLRETCGVGFFRNWTDLERWSSRHKSHLAIFNGAIRHAKEFGEDRRLMTWHEVSILKHGDASFEYINCSPQTGAIQFVPLKEQMLDNP